MFERMHHTVGDNVGARRNGLPTAVVWDHFGGGGRRGPVGRTPGAAQQPPIRGPPPPHPPAAPPPPPGAGARRSPDPPLPAAGGKPAHRCGRRLAIFHLRGQPAMQIGQKLLTWRVYTRSGRLQVYRGADLRSLEVVGPERLWTLPAQQVVNVAPQRTCVHHSSFPLTYVANCSPALQRLGVGHADTQLWRRVHDRTALQKPQFQDPGSCRAGNSTPYANAVG